MTKKQEKFMMVGSVIIIILLIFGIFKLNKYYDDKHQEEIALEMEERAKEEERLEKIELEKKKEDEIKKAEEMEKLREQFRKDAIAQGKLGTNQSNSSNSGTGKVPAPETRKTTDKDGNKITVTKVPKINPNSVSDEVEKPSKKEPAPTTPPKDNPNATVTKPPTSARDENKGGNNTTYPNTKPTEENKNNTNANINNNGVYNPFTDPSVPASKPRSSNSEDLLAPGEKMGQGDKF